MPILSDKPHLWKADVSQTIDFCIAWCLCLALATYRKKRVIRVNQDLVTFEKTVFGERETLIMNPAVQVR